jgi:hypothetical protein
MAGSTTNDISRALERAIRDRAGRDGRYMVGNSPASRIRDGDVGRRRACLARISGTVDPAVVAATRPVPGGPS